MAGYSNKPLYKKLGIKPGASWTVVHPPDHYLEMLGDDHPEVFGGALHFLNGVHVFVKDLKTLTSVVGQWKNAIKKDGMIWISWYKKASGIATDVTEDTIRAVALPEGLVDVKVCAVDDQRSGLKLVWRKELR